MSNIISKVSVFFLNASENGEGLVVLGTVVLKLALEVESLKVKFLIWKVTILGLESQQI